jgi:hypothetical protein
LKKLYIWQIPKKNNMENKTSTLNKKLKSYSAIAGTLVAAANTANAQIIYTDVIPDASVNTGGTYNLDLDNDGTADFQFAVTHGTYMYGTLPVTYDVGILSPGPGNAIDTISGGAVAHNLNDPINASLAWVDDAGAAYQLLGISIFGGAYTGGNFLGQTNKYLALRFKIGSNDHYGWARIDMDAGATNITVKDYAYDGTPNTMIPAGATVSVGINENNDLAKNVIIFSNDKAIHVNVNDNSNGLISVTNTLGQEVSKVEITESQNLISMENASAGIYFVTVTQGSSKTTKKVIIK